MSEAFSNLGRVFWRLLPANPILIRVVSGGSKRIKHLWVRLLYLSVLLGVVFFYFVARMSQVSGASLADMAKSASQMFMLVSFVQLGMMCFLAPVFAAGAITQEKDSQTFNILLTTPLTNGQIVFGSLMSRMYFVLMLLFSGLPICAMTMIYGGVTLSEIVISFAIAGSTALLTGSIAIAISMIRVGTRKTILSFYLLIGFYLIAVYMAGGSRVLSVPEAPANPSGRSVSWVSAFHPFLSLDVGLNVVPAPAPGAVAHYGRLGALLLAYPHFTYIAITASVAVLLVMFSMFFVRRVTKEGEDTLFNRLASRLQGKPAGERRRKPRHVWRNPVAWREAMTRASAFNRGWLRYGVVVVGVAAALALFIYYATGTFTLAETRTWLASMVLIEFGVVLITVTNTSATAMTKEREADTMDLLLCTPLDKQYIVWGKLRGLVSFTMPLLCIPLASMALFVIGDLFRGSAPPVVFWETPFLTVLSMIVFTSLACMIGLQTSLKSKKTVRAVMVSLALVLTLVSVFSIMGAGVVGNAGSSTFSAFFGPFTPLTTITAAIDPERAMDLSAMGVAAVALTPADRLATFFGTLLSAGVYFVIIHQLHRSMVRNFDMIVRKQSA